MQKGLESAILRTFFADSYKIKNNMRCMLDKLNCVQYNITKHKQRNLFYKEVYVMNSIPQKKKKLSLILKIIVIVSAFAVPFNGSFSPVPFKVLPVRTNGAAFKSALDGFEIKI